MHEYLHKYFENVKKLETKSFFSIRNMRPLSNVSSLPPAGRYRGVLPPALVALSPIHTADAESPTRLNSTVESLRGVYWTLSVSHAFMFRSSLPLDQEPSNWH